MPQSSPIDEATAQYLISDESRGLRDSVAQMPGDAPQRVLALRKRGIPIPFANAVVELIAARVRARRRFPDADRLFFTSDALAQATSARLAAYHAARLAPLGTVADLGCGVGMDAIALARAGALVLAIEHDPVRLLFARANAVVCGVADRIAFRLGDITTLDWSADAVYWDPSRRDSSDGHRVSRHADRYEPPLSFLEAIRQRAPRGGCVKLSPALPDDVLDELDGSVAFLSEGRECKEACVWFGAARSDEYPAYSAVLLPEGLAIPRDSSETGAGAPQVVPFGAYVFDPDPAIIRATALGGLARMISAGLVSAADSYLTGDRDTVEDGGLRRAASAYRVMESMPYRPRDVSAWLRGRGIGRLVVKKRHFSKEPDAVARELGLSGRGAEVTLILVRRDEGGHLAVFCEPVTDDTDA